MAEVEEAAGGRVRIGRGVSRDEPEGTALPEDGKVENVCKRWLIHEDGAIAHRLQQEEFSEHYGLNRKTRRTVRGDIQVSKFVQSEEEMQAQEERLNRLEEMKRLAEQDAQVAKQFEEEAKRQEEENSVRQRRKELDDEELASQYQEYLMRREQDLLRRRLTEDELVARQISDRLRVDSPVDEQGLTDEQLAIKLQKKEEQRYERRKREWELKKERRRIEKALAQHSTELGIEMPSQRRSGDEPDAGETETVEDTGDFSDFYVKPSEPLDKDEQLRLQQEQDMEIARLLQEQEHKRRGGVSPSGLSHKDKLKQIEAQDAELARIIQEQERLKAKKSRHKPKQQRHEEQMTRSQSLPSGHSREDDTYMVPNGPHTVERMQSLDEDSRVPPAGDDSFDSRPGSYSPPHNHAEDINPAKRSMSQNSPPPSSLSFNIAEAIDPTFRRSRASQSPPQEPAPPVPSIKDRPPYPPPTDPEVRNPQEVWNPLANEQYVEEDYDDQGIAPVQGMRRSGVEKKGKKPAGSGKRSSCKQQ